MRLILAATALISGMGSVPATAATLVTFGGSGTVESSGGRLVPSGAVGLGDALRFSFRFDAERAALVGSDLDYRLFFLPVFDFSAALGNFTFDLSSGAHVQIARGSAFFGGNASEPAVGYTFYLDGVASDGAPDEPFLGTLGRGQRLAVTAVYRDRDSPDALAVGGLLGAGTPAFETFQYTAGLGGRDTGVLAGSYVGGVTASAVPEPTTWALMILGFAMTGAGLRRRSRATALAA
jgi:hypothetical protein